MMKITRQKGVTCFNEEKVVFLHKLIKERDFTTISRAFKAIGHKKRLAVLYLISQGELCVCDLANAMVSPLPTVSQYLKILKDGGLIEDRQDKKFIIYHLTDLGRKIIEGFLNE